MAKARRSGLQEFTERFGQRVAELRRRRGWTQAKLAEKLDVGDAYVAKLEVGMRRPSFELLYNICLVLDTPARELFNFDESAEWEGVAWEAEAQAFREALAGRSADDVRLLREIAERVWR